MFYLQAMLLPDIQSALAAAAAYTKTSSRKIFISGVREGVIYPVLQWHVGDNYMITIRL